MSDGRSVNARTQIAAVIGSPVRHSLSPVIHNAAFAAHGDNWVYGAFEVDPEHAVAAIDAMRILGISGLSITMPHKEMVMAALDELHPTAALVRAVNTVVRINGRLVGHNTDGVGCVDALRTSGADLASVAVIGAGATARAVIAALASTGAKVGVANRSETRQSEAVAIGNAVRTHSTTAIGLHEVANSATIINTTPQGMTGVAVESVPMDTSTICAHHTVLDAVYHPRETEFLRAARTRGARTVDGVDMLCAQAARQQELWLGRLPDVALLRQAALAELAKLQQ